MKVEIESVIERARRYVAQVPGAISGSGGHNQTFAVACALVHGFALAENEAQALLREYNQRCQPSWSERDLVHKITSAVQARHSKPRGYLLGSAGCHFEHGAFSPSPALSDRPRAKIDPATATENFLKGFRCDEVDLWEVSPIRPPDDWTKDALALLQSLYRPGENVNFVTVFKVSTEKDGPRKARPVGLGETVSATC